MLTRRFSLGQSGCGGESNASETNSAAGGTSLSKKQGRVSFNPEREVLNYEEDSKEKRNQHYKDVLFVSDDDVFLEEATLSRLNELNDQLRTPPSSQKDGEDFKLSDE